MSRVGGWFGLACDTTEAYGEVAWGNGGFGDPFPKVESVCESVWCTPAMGDFDGLGGPLQ